MTLLTFNICATQLMHHSLLQVEKEIDTFIWEETCLNPFDELIVSWNAKRPLEGEYLIQVSICMTNWSSWFDYALWGAQDQHTFECQLPKEALKISQDIIEVMEGNKATGFKIRIVAKDNASLEQFEALHVSATDRSTHTIEFKGGESVFINLPVRGLSQVALPDERHLRLCSPTSTTAVINFLSNSSHLSPLEFADAVVDSSFDIYGNWVLNTAQAFHKLERPWYCFVARLENFNQIIDQLRKGYPVVVSIKGPLKGSALAYNSGHLLVVKGYDSKKQEVLCMDPAFSTNELTDVKYELSEFLAAWGRRQGIAYIFDQ